MKEKYTIEVNEIGVEKITAKFENAGNAATRLSAKAGGLFTGITGKVKGYISALNEATAGANRYAKALLGVKVGGTAPYKAIAAELDVLQAKAIALQSVLTKIPKTAGAFQKATYGPSAITPGITGFTPIAPMVKKDLNVSRSLYDEYYMQVAQAEARKYFVVDPLIKKQREQQAQLLNQTKQIENAEKQMFTGRLAYLNKTDSLGTKVLQKGEASRIIAEKSAAMNEKLAGVTQEVADSEFKKAKAATQTAAAVNNVASATNKSNTATKQANNLNRADVDAQKQRLAVMEQAKKEMGMVNKQAGFLNSGFAKFSIIMSGIAATLFVWQTVSRIIASVVRIGTDMEVAYAKVAHNLKLSADEMARLNTEARKQQSLGGPPVKDYVALVAEFEKWGMSHEAAINYVNAALEKEREILKGTVTGELREFKGLWVEIASQSFESSKSGFVELLSSMNMHLRQFTEAEGWWDKLKTGVEKYVRALTTVSPPLRAQREIWTRILGLIKEAEPFLSKIGSEILQTPQPSADVNPPRAVDELNKDRLALVRAENKEMEDITRQYTIWNTELGKVDIATWGVALGQEEIAAQSKNMQRDMKIASDILGEMNAKQLENQLRAIELTMKNVAGAIPDINKQIHVARVLIAAQRQANIQPKVNVWQSFYKEVGIMDERLYAERKKRIEELYNAQMTAQGDEDPQGLAAAARNEALFKLDEQYYAAKVNAGRQFYELFGYMTDDFIDRQLAKIDNLYLNDLKSLTDHQAEMLKEEREYLLERQKLLTPMAFYKKYYDEMGYMSQEYYDEEKTKIKHEYKMNAQTDPRMAERLKKRQEYVLDMKKTFSEYFEVEGKLEGITTAGIQNMEEMADKTGRVAEKLKLYWDLRAQLDSQIMAATTGDPSMEPAYYAQEKLENEKKSMAASVKAWEEHYQRTGLITQDYYDWQKKYINDSAKAETLAAEGNSKLILQIEQNRIAAIENLDRSSNAKKMELLGQAAQNGIAVSDDYYQKMVAFYEWDKEQFIKATGDKQAAEERFQKSVLQLRIMALQTSEKSIDGFALQAAKVQQSTKTAAERTAETLQNIVEGTKDVWSDFVFTAMDDYSNLWDLFEQTVSNWKRMIDRMVANWIAAGIAKMMFGDLAGGTGLLGGTGSSGSYGILGAIGGMIGSALGGMGSTPTGMTGQSINAALMLVKAAGGVFDRQGEVQKFATGAVFDKTTPFAYAGGTGVLGEAGPEAIVPLKRGPDGKLGIAEFGPKGDRITISPTIIVQAPEGRIPRDSMNQITSRLGRTIMGSMNRNN